MGLSTIYQGTIDDTDVGDVIQIQRGKRKVNGILTNYYVVMFDIMIKKEKIPVQFEISYDLFRDIIVDSGLWTEIKTQAALQLNL